MWFLIVAFLRVALARLRWSGSPIQLGQSIGEYKVIPQKSGAVLLRVGVSCRNGFEFELRRANEWDRTLSRAGLARAQRSGDAAFDALFYLVSEDPRVGALLGAEPALRALALGLFSDELIFAVGSLNCRGGLVWVEGWLDPAHKDKRQEAASGVAPVLEAWAQALQVAPERRGLDRGLLTAIGLSAFSAGLAVQGFVLAARPYARSVLNIIDRSRLTGFSLALSALSFAALLAMGIFLLRKTSRTPALLPELIFVGGLGCLLASFNALDHYNIEADQGPAQAVAATVLRLEQYGCGKHKARVCYRAQLEPDGSLPTRLLRLRPVDFQRLTGAGRARILVRPGALRVRWIERVDPLDP